MMSLVDSVLYNSATARPMIRPPRNFSARSRLRTDMSDLEGEIDRTRRMRERPDGNKIHAGGCDLADVFQSNTAAGFKFHFAFAEREGLANLSGFHVVEQNHVDPFNFEKASDLLERVGLDLDLDSGMRVPKFSHRVRERVESGTGDKMVVFQHDHVEQTEAMVRSAAGDDGGLFQRAQSGRRFASIKNFHMFVCGCVDELSRQGRDPGQTLQKIERDALGFKNRTGSALDIDHTVAGLHF